MALPSSDDIVKALINDGFQPRGKPSPGSHQVFRKRINRETKTVVVPLGRKEIPRGTMRSMIRQAGPTANNLAALI